MLRDQAHGWLRLGEVAPQLLIETRLQTVWASRLLAAVATAHVAPAATGTQTCMEWLGEPELLAGEPATDGRSFRAALRISNLSLVLLDASARPFEEFALERRTLEDGRAWLEDVIARYRHAKPVPLRVPRLGLQDHPVAGGRVFDVGAADACVELARWYAGADVVLRELVSVTAGASPVRCWIERLDLRSTIPLHPGSAARPEGLLVGMSPGDTSLAEPYWYVVPPRLRAWASLPALGHGAEWYAKDWAGAVLRARKLLPGSAYGQRERLVAFLEEAISVGRDLASTPA